MRAQTGIIGISVSGALIAGLIGLGPAIDAVAQCHSSTLIASNADTLDLFGQSVATDGRWVVIGASQGDGRAPDTGAVYVYDLRSIPPWGRSTERDLLAASDGEEGDGFHEVALLDNLLVVGASGTDDFGASTGAAYVFRWTGSAWVQETKLLAEDARRYASFGSAVALTGRRILIGASGDDDLGSSAGAAYVFVRDAGGWTQSSKLTASDGDAVDLFGNSVALEGDYAVIGAVRNEVDGVETGSAYIFHREGGAWTEQARLVADDSMEDDDFGEEVAISGEYVAVGAPRHDQPLNSAGAVYVFRREGTTWTQVSKLRSRPAMFSGQFGEGLAMRGDRLLVGTPGGSDGGSAFLFQRQADEYVQVERLWTPGVFDSFGLSVALGEEHIVAGGPFADLGAGLWSGVAYVYRLGVDGPLNFRDYAVFQTCFTGEEGGRLSDCCKLYDFDEDRDVDRDDFNTFIDRFTGP